MTKGMGIDNVANLGDERMKGGSMVLYSGRVVMSIKERLKKISSSGVFVGRQKSGVREEPGEKFLGGGGGMSFSSVCEWDGSEFAIVRESR